MEKKINVKKVLTVLTSSLIKKKKMLTLNQNIEILKNFTLKHRSLNSYFHEGVNKLSLNNDTPIYPKFESILESLDTTNDIFSVKFKIFISDLVKKDNTNRDIVISDCSLIANDFLYYVRKIVRDGILPGFKCQKRYSIN